MSEQERERGTDKRKGVGPIEHVRKLIPNYFNFCYNVLSRVQIKYLTNLRRFSECLAEKPFNPQSLRKTMKKYL